MASLFVATLLNAGCATTDTAASGASPQTVDSAGKTAVGAAVKTAAKTAVKPPPTPQQVGDTTLTDGITLYDKGDFIGAIRLLQGTPEIWSTSVDTRLQAYKYVAFSFCLSNRRAPCRNAFDELLKLNPAYELTTAEVGHPMWGPVFKQAKRDLKGPPKAHSTERRL